MKAEVNENDIVKHWGIWIKGETEDTSGWLTSEGGILFSVTCPRVANLQHDAVVKLSNWTEDDIEVREMK